MEKTPDQMPKQTRLKRFHTKEQEKFYSHIQVTLPISKAEPPRGLGPALEIDRVTVARLCCNRPVHVRTFHCASFSCLLWVSQHPQCLIAKEVVACPTAHWESTLFSQILGDHSEMTSQYTEINFSCKSERMNTSLHSSTHSVNSFYHYCPTNLIFLYWFFYKLSISIIYYSISVFIVLLIKSQCKSK